MIMRQTLLKVLTLLVSVNQVYGGVALKKFKPGDYETDFIETPVRYIIINRDKCDEGLSCDNVAYYEINKKTGKTFKIPRGETINIGPNYNFRGYYFTTKDRRFLYEIVFQGNPTLDIMHPKTYELFSEEEIRDY